MIKFLILFIICGLLILFYWTNKIAKKKIHMFNFWLILCVVFSIGTFFIVSSKLEQPKVYHPPVYDGKKVKPGFFSEKNT